MAVVIFLAAGKIFLGEKKKGGGAYKPLINKVKIMKNDLPDKNWTKGKEKKKKKIHRDFIYLT